MINLAELKLKKVMNSKRKRRLDLEKLKENADSFRKYIEERLETTGTRWKDPNEKWNEIRNILHKGAAERIGYKRKVRIRKPRITEEMIKKMDERRQAKKSKPEEGRKKYRALNNELRRITEKAFENWWDKECANLELLEKQGRTDLMYAHIKKLTENKKTRNGNCKCIKDKAGIVLKEPEEIKRRWKEYIEDLYDNKGKPSMEEFYLEVEDNVKIDDKGPDLIIAEIELAINDLKNGKSEGIDEILAELLKVLGEKGKRELFKLCQDIYVSGEWPDDFIRSTIITLEKKLNALECANHGTISLISHASKIMLKVMARRLE